MWALVQIENECILQNSNVCLTQGSVPPAVSREQVPDPLLKTGSIWEDPILRLARGTFSQEPEIPTTFYVKV